MPKIKMLALLAALALVGCTDSNDDRIEAFKKCKAAGMVPRDAQLQVRCTVPKEADNV